MFTVLFWRQAFERAAKTFVQSLLAVGLVGAVDILSVDWAGALSAAALATLLSVLSSIVSAPAGPEGSPSLVEAAQPALPAPDDHVVAVDGVLPAEEYQGRHAEPEQL